MYYAAGVLPITWVDGTLLILVGKELRDGTFADFGGKCERSDRNDPLTTAVREFVEETYGMVTDFRTLRLRLCPSNCLMLKSSTQNSNAYYMYLTEIPYSPHLRNIFHKALSFLKMKNLKILVEKTDVRWVTLDTLLSPSFSKRSVFAHTIELHKDALLNIAKRGEPWRSLCEMHAAQHGFLGLHGVADSEHEIDSVYSRSPPSASTAVTWRSYS